jgi:hypothetical protein
MLQAFGWLLDKDGHPSIENEASTRAARPGNMLCGVVTPCLLTKPAGASNQRFALYDS